jgi:hypothetical protein
VLASTIRRLRRAQSFSIATSFAPGEMLHVKGVVRRGMLGALAVPEATDSVRLVIRRQRYTWADDSTLVIRDTVMRTSGFGTVVDSVRLRDGLPLGAYNRRSEHQRERASGEHSKRIFQDC